MKHARRDYDHIQDPSGKIPSDEPVFLLRGQDKHAALAVRFYAAVLSETGGDRRLIDLAPAHADAMDAWTKHKEPDL